MLSLHTHTQSETAAQAASNEHAALDAALEAAWGTIAPLWTLRNFVAVNPYSGFVGLPFPEATRQVETLFHARAVMPRAYHQARRAEGAYDEGDVVAARSELAALAGGSPAKAPVCTRTPLEVFDAQHGTQWAQLACEEVARWCAARFDQAQAAWSQPGRERPLWPAFRAQASYDRTVEIRGLRGFRSYLRDLPDAPRLVIRRVLNQLGVPQQAWPQVLSRVLASVKGWAGHVRYRSREAGLHGRDDGDEQLHFIAIRLAFEGAGHAALGHPPVDGRDLYDRAHSGSPEPLEDRLVGLHALERGYRRRLVARLRGAQGAAVRAPRLQAVFCIDVRSEVLRRHLEDASPHVQTLGFAGFFGFGLQYTTLGAQEGTSRCPALIAPSHRIVEGVHSGADLAPKRAHARRDGEVTRHRAALSTRLSTVSSFSFAETAGAWFGVRLLTDALRWTGPRPDGAFFESSVAQALAPEVTPRGKGPDTPVATGLDLAARLDLAEAALRGMGLTQDFAPIVLLCGHGSQTTNNPFGSGLDCGACGGHSGDVNAKVAAEVFNDPQVRLGLRERGIDVPTQTIFVAGLHNTTTDEVTLFDSAQVAESELTQVQAWLRGASTRTRRERLKAMCPDADALNPEVETRRRSRDWSEVRPEWGLAKNAGFIAARRARTRGLDLQGRVFLHDYDAGRDPEGHGLQAIMTAPMVVAHWINMQYYASTVDNDVFGAGTKVLHNVVGRHGVQVGNRSDLQVGLPLQSVHDGQQPYHEPLRLQVVLEALPQMIDRVLAKDRTVRQLVDNGWLTLVAWHPGCDTMSRRRPGGGWISE